MTTGKAFVRVLGVPELVARMGRGIAVGAEALAVTQHQLAEDVATLAREKAPVGSAADGDEDPGRLRDSIHAEQDRVVADAPYAVYVEYGTVNMDAEPYLRPAADTVDRLHAIDSGLAVLRRI